MKKPIYKITQGKISWWKEVLLWFCRKQYGYDFGSGDKNAVVIYKKLFGVFYIIGFKLSEAGE